MLKYLIILSTLFFLPLYPKDPTPMSENEIRSLGADIYIYGYPLVTMEMTRRVMTNTATPEGSKAPMGQFANMSSYPDSSFHDVTAPNADTLYSVAWLDLSEGPYILHLPDEKKRYYLMPILSGWTDVIADPGTRTTGTKEGNYAITGPHWKGSLPRGVKEYKSPTNLVWILGRTYCSATEEDYEKVRLIQKEYTLTPLSAYGSAYTPPPGVVDPKVNMKTPVREQVNSMSSAIYFRLLASLLKNNPPSSKDSEIVSKMAKIGMVPGKDYDLNKVDKAIAAGLDRSTIIGLKRIMNYGKNSLKRVGGWVTPLDTGKYGTDYLHRAKVAYAGLGANLPEDALYPYTSVDSDNQPLNGNNRYVLHFSKGDLPPVKGFWSLTLYNKSYFFVDNPLNRYNLSPKNGLKFNKDGSLDLYIQQEPPEKKEFESNWLPAPSYDFILVMRLYWPGAAALSGKWSPPAVQKVKSP